jgi:hypothetical protein
MLTISADAALGVSLAVLLFATPNVDIRVLVFSGACAGMRPDVLKFAYVRCPREPLVSLQQFDRLMHRNRPVLGIISQRAFLAVIVVLVHALLTRG